VFSWNDYNIVKKNNSDDMVVKLLRETSGIALVLRFSGERSKKSFAFFAC